MNKIEANDTEAKSADIITDNLSKLQSLFPEVFAEGKVHFDVLRQLLGDAVDETDEKFGLNWHGKRRARQIALTPSTGTLRPCPEKNESVDWETTQNLMIEGDNLEALKLLQKSYSGKVKMIYIDPPYNTGKDFVYPDNYHDSIESYLELTGQIEGGAKLTANSDASGRFHTDWLNMMYPRLKLARSLLCDDGVMAIHIDENEYTNLECILSEIFGENCNLGTVVWDKRNPKGEVAGVAQQHELISFYCKNKDTFANSSFFVRKKENASAMMKKAASLVKAKGGVNAEVRAAYLAWLKEKKNELSGGEYAYSMLDDDGNIYQPVSMAAPDRPETRSHRALVHPVTRKPCPVPAMGWRFPDKTMDALLAKGEVLFGVDETTQPRRKYLLADNLTENVPSLLYFGGSDDALGIPFPNPKPVAVAAKLIDSVCKSGEIVMDFFAGSATTAHATWELNVADGGNRRFILVQLPERLDANNKDQKAAAAFCDSLKKPRLLSELTKERLRLAGKKIKEDNPDIAIDLGFRVFKLDKSNIRLWNPNPENLAKSLLDHHEHVLDGRTEADITYELLLKLGLDLCVPMETRTVAGKSVEAVGGGVLVLCLAEKLAAAEVEAVAAGIVAWHKELAPAGDSTVVFRDSAFDSDVAKTNMAAILAQNGLENVRSL